ncbi:MAG: hypothetical protein F2534_01245 [Actinobacteria bacterium]|nr:hypothetical protein [Actinomycetota bacterium]
MPPTGGPSAAGSARSRSRSPSARTARSTRPRCASRASRDGTPGSFGTERVRVRCPTSRPSRPSASLRVPPRPDTAPAGAARDRVRASGPGVGSGRRVRASGSGVGFGNRGIGEAFVRALLAAGASRVYVDPRGDGDERRPRAEGPRGADGPWTRPRAEHRTMIATTRRPRRR